MGSKNKKKSKNNPSAEKDSKVSSDGGGDGGKLVTDERFSRVHWDPRFRTLSKQGNKVELDSRFKSMFSDKRFSSSATPLDKRGRPKKQNKQNHLHRYYRIEENKDKEEETDEEVEEKEKEEEEEDSGSTEEELEQDAAALKTAQLSDESEDSEPVSSSEVETDDTESTVDTDEDDEEHVYEEEDVQEQEENIPNIDKETHRLAVVNMDWRHVKAVDLFVVLSSFLPNNGRILSVAVYPTEFGLQRMKEEELRGPVGLFDGENDEDEKEHEENDEDIDKEKLRAYEKSRLRYFHAVVECDSVSTADYLYTACDGAEFERSSNVLDLRFIPDSWEFKHPPRDVATERPANYDGLDFQTRCLQQSNIELTWDEDEPERKPLKEKFNPNQIADMDLRDYLASDESDSDEEEENKDTNNEEEKKDKKRNKYLSLLGDGSDDGSGDDNEKLDMEVTFNPGLEDLGKRILEKKAAQSETVFESFQRKKREKKMMRKNKSKDAALSDGNSSDADEKEAEGDGFFIEEEEEEDEAPVKKSSKKDRLGKDKMKNEMREAADGEKEATAAELELLFADETGGAGNAGPKGYNLKRKNAKGKKKKKKKNDDDDNDVDELAKLPTLDDVDSRFSDIYTSEFALDPTDPNYKRSATYLRHAVAAKRKQQKGDDNNNEPPPENRPQVKNKEVEATSNSKREKYELSSLVKSLKMKSMPLPMKEEDGLTTRRDNNKNKRNREEKKKTIQQLVGSEKKGKRKKVEG